MVVNVGDSMEVSLLRIGEEGMEFKGVYTAIITPFQKNGEAIDYDAYRSLVEKQVEAGIEGIVPCGTTGESPTLSHEEHRELIQKTVEFVGGSIKVIAGTGSNSTHEAMELTKDACQMGVDSVMVVNPYYNKPNQEGLYLHFKSVAESSTKPVVVYNIKGRTGVNIEVETMRRLTEIPMIGAVKEASGDPGQMIRLHKACQDRLPILSGDDNITPAVMGLGGKGVISVLSNLYPRRMVQMMKYYLEGDFEGGNRKFYALVDAMNAMFWDTNPIPVKKAAFFMGLASGDLRLPLTELDPTLSSKLKEVLDRTGEDA